MLVCMAAAAWQDGEWQVPWSPWALNEERGAGHQDGAGEELGTGLELDARYITHRSAPETRSDD